MPDTILLVDDEPSMLEFLDIMLSRLGFTVLTASSGEKGLKVYREKSPNLILTDVKMPGMSGLDLMKKVHDLDPEVPIIAVTAYSSAEDALRAVREGAYDYISKPFQIDDLRLVIRNALEAYRLRKENTELRQSVENKKRFGSMVGKSYPMLEIFTLISRVAPSTAGVLIMGESGTGKELIARAIHQNSQRSDRPFVTVNCAAIPENLLESEMFGHMKGAFTGAASNKPGLVETAHTGTLFLDEVGEIPPSMQAKLLRFLQDGECRRVGGSELRKVDARIIAATNRNLEQEMGKGAFREDLYYRLNVIKIVLPPLRERTIDIPILVDHFLKKYSALQGKTIRKCSSLAIQVLCNYSYPGNIRELENIIERCVTLEQSDELTAHNLPRKFLESSAPTPEADSQGFGPEGMDLTKTLEDMKRRLITRALETAENNRSRAADLLGISFRSLRYRMLKLGMEA